MKTGADGRDRRGSKDAGTKQCRSQTAVEDRRPKQKEGRASKERRMEVKLLKWSKSRDRQEAETPARVGTQAQVWNAAGTGLRRHRSIRNCSRPVWHPGGCARSRLLTPKGGSEAIELEVKQYRSKGGSEAIERHLRKDARSAYGEHSYEVLFGG